MKLHRFIGPFDLSRDALSIDDRNLCNQIKNVLKLKVGERIILADGKMNEAETEIFFAKKNIELRILRRYKNTNEPMGRVELCCALLKREHFELVVQKATEIGVASITPLITQRTVKQGVNLERLGKIAHEAAEQSGRGVVPFVHAPVAFKDIFKKVDLLVENYFFDFDGISIDMLSEAGPQKRLCIGPEGGWTEEERVLAKDAGWQSVSLGPLAFRAETAAIIASYLAVRL